MMRPCQKCKERATLHVTEIEGDEFQEIHLCYKCAEKYLHEAEESIAAQPAPDPSQLAAAAAAQMVSNAKCPLCKTTFNDFRETGRLGCPNDYDVFREPLMALCQKIHDSTRHIGKVPRQLPVDTKTQTRLMQLRKELTEAIAVEDYEKAAKLRDQIEGMEKAQT